MSRVLGAPRGPGVGATRMWAQLPVLSVPPPPPAGIRQLQLILLKVALLLGVEVHINVQFKDLLPPASRGDGQGKAPVASPGTRTGLRRWL